MGSSYYTHTLSPCIIARFGDEPIGWSGDNAIFNCPFCEEKGKGEDTHGKLWVHNKKLMYQCFRCGTKGTVKGIVKNYDFTKKITETSEFEVILDDIINPRSRYSFSIEYPYDIPSLIPTPDSRYYHYLINRGLTPQLIAHYQIKVASCLSKYHGRIMIPNDLVVSPESQTLMTDMFVARSVDPDESRRYLNPMGENKSKVVFNLHRIPKGSPIIICEGVFTAISAGINAIATYGKFVSDLQIHQILRNNPPKLYVNLDSDARKEALELCERILRMGYTGKLYITNMPEGKDASDLGHYVFMQYLVSATLYDRNLMKVFNLMKGR